MLTHLTRAVWVHIAGLAEKNIQRCVLMVSVLQVFFCSLCTFTALCLYLSGIKAQLCKRVPNANCSSVLNPIVLKTQW